MLFKLKVHDDCNKVMGVTYTRGLGDYDPNCSFSPYYEAHESCERAEIDAVRNPPGTHDNTLKP